MNSTTKYCRFRCCVVILGLMSLALLFIARRSAAHPQPKHAPPERKPNIVVIVADDLGYGDLSSYGADDLQTPNWGRPNIDSLVAAGMRFDQFYANSSVCSPTRAALLSGRYSDLAGVPGVIRTRASNSWGYLDPDARLLPDVLQDAGYYTGMVGKWHLGLEPPNTPSLRGFDFFKGFLGDMMDDYYTHRRRGLNYMRDGDEAIDPKGHATNLFTRWATEYVSGRASSEAPFFLYLAYTAPHAPIQPPEEWLKKVRRREPNISAKRAKIVALIEHMDHGVGQVVEALKEAGQYENTLIVFTSDNGGALGHGASNGPLRAGKGSMYEGGLRVPMCAVWPGHIPAGSRSDRVALTMDLYPTALAAAGMRLAPNVDGKSLLPVLLGNEVSPELKERPVFFVRREGRNAFMGQTTYAVRRGDWKLLQTSVSQPFELYNLAEDPQEEHDLKGEHTQTFNEMAELVRRHMHRAGRVPWQKPSTR